MCRTLRLVRPFLMKGGMPYRFDPACEDVRCPCRRAVSIAPSLRSGGWVAIIEYVLEHANAYDGPQPPSTDHAGIKWYLLAGAD